MQVVNVASPFPNKLFSKFKYNCYAAVLEFLNDKFYYTACGGSHWTPRRAARRAKHLDCYLITFMRKAFLGLFYFLDMSLKLK